VAADFEFVRRVRTVQKLIVERSAITHAFGRKLSPGFHVIPSGRRMPFLLMRYLDARP
jgi:hypothetical protein